jgi:hypothetical protein
MHQRSGARLESGISLKKINLKDIKDGWTNLFTSYFSIKSTSPEFKEEVEKRASICRDCPELKHTIFPESVAPLRFKCGKCSCFFPAVVFAPDHKCPLDKW